MLLRVLAAVVCAVSVGGYTGPDLPPGPYCGGICCDARKDDCSHPILGTMCYCDEFCMRNGTRPDDCCPDYTADCTDEEPEQLVIETCSHESGQYYKGAKIAENCNTCTCVGDRWECTTDECIISERVLSSVNSQYRGWSASNYSQFWGRTLRDGLQLKLGTLPLKEITLRMMPDPSYPSSQLPTSFDARTRWPGFISPVYDQGWCGADWAVATAAVASDRFAIQSNGAENVHLSAQHLLCAQGGCKGGYVDSAWLFVRHKGLVDEACLPYTGPVRRRKCPAASTTLAGAGCLPAASGRTERYRTSPVKRLGSVEDIMYEIYTSGPVQAVMTVHQDFFAYRGGVYRHIPATDRHGMSGLHAVRIVGWGEDNGHKYWTVGNSWGSDWGERGYFRIARGENESDVEKFVLSTLADVHEANTESNM